MAQDSKFHEMYELCHKLLFDHNDSIKIETENNTKDALISQCIDYLYNYIKTLEIDEKIDDPSMNIITEEDEKLINNVINEIMKKYGERMIKKHTNILNVYIECYKQLLNVDDINIFDGIDYDNNLSTNQYMEFLYQIIDEFKKNRNSDDSILYECAIHEPIEKNVYVLQFKNKIFYCKLLYPLIIYLSELDWINLDWYIKYNIECKYIKIE